MGVWVREQRKLHQETSADPIRKERLEALPGWSWEGLGTQQWEAAFSRLLRYTRRVGHSAVPYAYVEDGFPLGTWVNSRRSEYRRGLLAEKRIKQLESLPGWVWRGGRQSRQR